MAALARFTPSLLDEDTLDRLFVRRRHLLDDALRRIERAATSEERAHKLYVGPRGAGKTHLISLVYYRARRLRSLGSRFQLAWLPEDPWTIGSYEDFVRAVLDNLDPPVEPAGDAEGRLRHIAAESGPVVVLAENLDQILDALGQNGQRKLRGLLENHRPLLLVATATRLTTDLLDQAEPFYGFFDTTTLQPFDLDAATDMLAAIAELNGDQRLVTRLREPRARARLAAVQHLAGGQPRVWALLGAGLTVERLHELVDALVERFDDLTPYYQEQLARLSVNERKVVRTLADAGRAMNVRDLATATGIEQRSLAKTISELRRRGWIQARSGLLTSKVDRRLTFYELAEPLARLAFQLKAARGKPVKLVLDFLTAWFDQEEILSASGGSRAENGYLQAATLAMAQPVALIGRELSGGRSRPGAADPTAGRYAVGMRKHDPRVVAALESLDDGLRSYQEGDAVPLLRQPSELCQLVEHRLGETGPLGLRLELARLAYAAGAGDAWITRAGEILDSASAEERIEALLVLLLLHAGAQAGSVASLVLDNATEALRHSASPDHAASTIVTAEELMRLGWADAALDLLEAVRAKITPEHRLSFAMALHAAFFRTGRPTLSVDLWRETLDELKAAFGPDDPTTLASANNLAYAYHAAGRLTDALRLYERTVTDLERLLGPDHPDTLRSRNNLATVYHDVGRLTDALRLYERTLTDSERVLGPDHPNTLRSRNNLASTYRDAGQLADALSLFEGNLADSTRILGPDHPDTLTTRSNLATTYHDVGRLTDALPLYEQTLADRHRIFGPDHPDTLTSRNNLATAYAALGRLTDALPLFERTLADTERILGPDHPNSLQSRSNLATAYLEAGRLPDALPLLERILADRERILGPDHPGTAATRQTLRDARARSEEPSGGQQPEA